ncbi:hypothetical protein FKP32DRAFT_1586652 [Trametes sanguinea]|nr:hypothetical protein FKP32DRAFT_1586652 [Trametes sanguinea]
MASVAQASARACLRSSSKRHPRPGPSPALRALHARPARPCLVAPCHPPTPLHVAAAPARRLFARGFHTTHVARHGGIDRPEPGTGLKVHFKDHKGNLIKTVVGLTDTSRLGCQVRLTKELDGLTCTLPSATRNMFVDGKKPTHH